MTPGPERQAALQPRIAGLRLALERIGLPAWFVVIDLLWIAKPDVLGIDARHYQRAAAEWLAGGNPWTVTESGIPYAAGPHTLAFYAPTTFLPLSVAVGFWVLLGIAAGAWLVRRLGVPMWWLLFPPLVHAMWNGNPQTLMLALLVFGTPLAAAVASAIKLYALLAVAFHPRRLVVAVLVLLITLPLLPWALYLDQGFGVGSHIQTAWNGSAWRFPVLIPFVMIGLWILRRDGGEWYSVPAVFPATQFYYVSMVLPVITTRPLLAALLATPIPLAVPVVVIALAAYKVRAEFDQAGVASVRRLVFSR